MPLPFSDTDPQAEAVHLELLRQAPAWRKLEMVGQLNEAVRMLALAGLRQRHPKAGEAELRRRLADLYLGPDLAARAYGPLEVGEADVEAQGEPQDLEYLRRQVDSLGVADLLAQVQER